MYVYFSIARYAQESLGKQKNWKFKWCTNWLKFFYKLGYHYKQFLLIAFLLNEKK